MSKDDVQSELIETRKRAVDIIHRAAAKFRIPAYTISASQFWACAAGDVTDWQMRKIGSFTRVKEEEFPVPPDVIITESERHKPFVGHTGKLENFTCHDVTILQLFQMAKLKQSDVFKLVVMPDAHVEEHDPFAINAFMKFVSDYKPHGIVNLGDFMEMDAVTHWPAPDARPRRLVPQIESAKKLLAEIDQALGKQCVFKRFLIGNHEDWLDQYLVGKIPEALHDLEKLGVDLRFQELIGLKNFGYETVPLNEILRIGPHCHFIHGYYTNKHHASKHLEVFGVNVYYGHLHDVQQHSTVSVNGVHEAMCLGCLRNLRAPFLKGRPNNWSHAFGIFEFDHVGVFTRYVPVIINGRFSFNGKMYDGMKM